MDDELDGGLLAALVGLLEGTELAPPERLPAVVAAAGRTLGLRIVIYLVDYEQRTLMPLDPEHRPLDVDATLAGRAFRLVRMLPSEADGVPRLWVPLLDGVERLGVLAVTSTHSDSPHLRRRCRWLSALIGHLITAINQYGDGLDNVRLRRPRTPAGELIWELLPPLTTGTDNFVLAGLLEPSHDVGGDAFDYSVSETTATLAIFDAVGHTMRSGLMAAAALSTYRATRRAGHGLAERARAIDEAIAGHFEAGAFVTGVLAELELRTGRLHYLVAGHPLPLVLRAGKVVRKLHAGRRLPFGFGAARPAVGHETLQPEDWLVLYTDGITEARGRGSEQFGEARLVDFLEREVAADHPPPETVRRLIHAVLDHHDGTLQDDATVLLARWADREKMMP